METQHAVGIFDELYKNVFEESRDGICYCESVSSNGSLTDYKFVRVNEAFCKESPFCKGQDQIDFEEIKVSNFTNHPNFWISKFDEVVSTQKPIEFERYEEENNKWYEVRVIPADSSGCIGIFKDITETKIATTEIASINQELIELNKEFSEILESMSDGVIYQNGIGEIEFFNKRALDILKLSEDQLLGRTNFSPEWHTIKENYTPYPPDEHPAIISLRTGVSLENQVLGVSVGDDDYRWISINSTPTTNAKGEITGVLAVFRDITEIKRQSALIEANRESSAFLFKHSSDVLCILNSQGILNQISSSCKDLLGFEQGDLIFTNITENIYTDDLEQIRGYFERLQTQREVGRFSYRFHHGNGSIVWLETIFKPIAHRVGKISQVIATIRNIDKSKTLERDLRRLNDELNRSNQELTDFAYVASHDLQEPLRMVSSFSELLRREYGNLLDETGKKYLDFTLSGSKRMKRLIDDLLKYSRINTTDFGMEKVDILNIVDDVTKPYHSNLNHAEFQFSVQSITFTAIPSLIERVIQNLVENSLKFKKADEDVVIKIETRIVENSLQLIVADNGIGINPIFHEKILLISD